ncbi:MAG TPA: hypothetical protein VHP36_02235 [Chitinispirillaceae bacterium]|nr:hypothetical protein [Chitinispirillaceae bacterium]
MWKSQLFRSAMFLLVIAYGSVINAQYQCWTTDIEKYSYLSLGTAELDIENLNKTMANLGFSSFADRPFTFQLGSQIFIQHLVLESGIGGMIFRPRYSNERKATLLGGNCNFTMGVNLPLEGSSWKVYPFFGLGGAFYRFSHHPDNLKFEQNSSGDAKVYWLPSMITVYGCCIMRTVHLQKNELMSIGIRGGILVDPTRQSTWYRNGVSYRDGPAPQINGPFLQFIIAKGRYVTE